MKKKIEQLLHIAGDLYRFNESYTHSAKPDSEELCEDDLALISAAVCKHFDQKNVTHISAAVSVDPHANE